MIKFALYIYIFKKNPKIVDPLSNFQQDKITGNLDYDSLIHKNQLLTKSELMNPFL